VLGRFITRCYASRADFNEGRASDIYVAYNSFTDAGLRRMWEMLLGTVDDKILGLVVGNSSQEFAPDDTRLHGDQTAEATLDGNQSIEVAAGVGRIVLTATFGERDGMFEWAERGVVTAKGVLLDRSVGDQGRKPLGAVWQLEAALDLLR
jgi:hypothetical protein